MKIEVLKRNFSVCQVEDFSCVDFTKDFCFVSKTDEEHSLVCFTEDVPDHTIQREDGWRAFRIQGVLEFSMIGVLAEISTLLAENDIGIFAISTYNTDYILTKKENFDKALQVLTEKGYLGV